MLDDFSHECLGIEVDTNLPAARVLRVLDRIAAWRRLPAKLRMDNGPELISVLLADWAEERRGIGVHPARQAHTEFVH